MRINTRTSATIAIVASLILGLGSAPARPAALEEIEALFILAGGSYADTLRAEAAIEAAGGRVELIFPNRIIMGRIDRASAATLGGGDAVGRIEFGPVASRAGLTRPNTDERAAIDFWNESLSSQPAQAELDHGDLHGDALPPPAIHPNLQNRRRSAQVLTPVMRGKIAQTVFFVESNGKIDPDTEKWGRGWKAIKKEVIAGLKFWTSNAPKSAKLKFVVKFIKPGKAKTGYEPIGRSSNDEGLWISELMDRKGYTARAVGAGASYFDQVFAFNANRAKRTRAKGGAVSEFVINSKNDADGKFTNGRFGYAYLGGWFTVMTSDNNGWGESRFDWVQRHENGHLTGRALDEYSSSNCTCDQKSPNGTKNGNCAACSDAGGVMKSNIALICDFTKAMIGWDE
jgi:hypothetical protein